MTGRLRRWALPVVVSALLAGAGVAGCAALSPRAEVAAREGVAFTRAVQQGDGAMACRYLSEGAAEAVTIATGLPCERGVLLGTDGPRPDVVPNRDASVSVAADGDDGPHHSGQ